MKLLEPEDLEMVALFASLGLDERSAKVLAYLARVPEGASADIEEGCNLRQPEVSLATKGLRSRGWVHTTERHGGGKGRPSNVYRLGLELSAVVDTLEVQKRDEMEAELRKIRRLRAMLVD